MFILLRLVWPFVLRFAMKQASESAAAFLEARRQQRFGIAVEGGAPEANQEGLPVIDELDDLPVQTVCVPPPPPSFFNSDAFWFTLSGIVLGIAVSIVAAVIKRATEKQ
jgi:hypothetical protein